MSNPPVLSEMSDAVLTADRGEEMQTAIDRLTHELAARELDRRFRNALERGETDGDILIVDEHGQEVKAASAPVTIFDVQ